MNFTPVRRNRNTGLGAVTSLESAVSKLVKTAIENGFLPASFSQVTKSIFDRNLWIKAEKEAEGFVYPTHFGYVQNCTCADCIDFCSYVSAIQNLLKQSIFQSTTNHLGVYAAFVLSLMHITVNELEGKAQEMALSNLDNLMQNLPKEYQNKILGISDANIKYSTTQMETPAYIDPSALDEIQSDVMPKEPQLFPRGTAPNERTNDMMQTTSVPNPTTATTNYYVAETKTTPKADNSNWKWYVGGSLLFVGGITTAVVLLKPKKKKRTKKRRR
ncbi:hypothetical protein [Bernardetia sp.]|uniref:hypothetical protein n=1 Tax=Bernardetia sp. TaxID=1937974 RepID=UPI0025C66752|nr:hypothetical protein [Bernardetia sp.]